MRIRKLEEMTEDDAPDIDHASPWWARLLPTATFVVGLVIGGLVVLAVHGGGEPAASPSPSPSTASASPGDTVVTVPAACQDAADNIEEATSLLRETVSSVKNFDPDQIVKMLNRLQDLDQATRPLAKRCSQVKVTVGPSPSP